jgi:hypothetical protein
VARTRAGRRVRDLVASRASRGPRRTKRIPIRRQTVWRKRQGDRKGTPGTVRPRTKNPTTMAATYRPQSGRIPRAGIAATRTRPPTRRRVDRRQARVWCSTPIAGQPPRRCPATSPVRVPVLRRGRPAGPRRPRPTPLPRIPRPFAERMPHGPPGIPLCLPSRSPGAREPSRRLLLSRPRTESCHRRDTGCERRRRHPTGRRSTFSATSGTGVVFRSSGSRVHPVRCGTTRAVPLPLRHTEAPSRSGRHHFRSLLLSPASVSPWGVPFSVLRPQATATARCSP